MNKKYERSIIVRSIFSSYSEAHNKGELIAFALPVRALSSFLKMELSDETASPKLFQSHTFGLKQPDFGVCYFHAAAAAPAGRGRKGRRSGLCGGDKGQH
ncbi:hypothetical protein [Rahnella sikkimica]|uniref:hypothetical protein n=1 Tax=Rahnella sikkimica TaxID=1805933 RepID=UPI001CFF669D|nr:hypothetical protein [Rahnella sikkimica]